jgi:hypothetical protein
MTNVGNMIVRCRETGLSSPRAKPTPTAQVGEPENRQWERVLRDMASVFPSATAQVTGEVGRVVTISKP